MSISSTNKICLIWANKLQDQFSRLTELMTGDGWRIIKVYSTDNLETYWSESQGVTVVLAILNPVDTVYSESQLRQIWRLYVAGCSLMVAGGDNENSSNKTNLSAIVSPFGIKFNEDCVIRPNLYKNYHPKDAMLEDFIANSGFTESMSKFIGNKPDRENRLLKLHGVDPGPRIIYSRGCTLSVLNRSSTIIMTSSKWAIPTRQPICSVYRGAKSRMVAFGSASSMDDRFIDLEDNKALVKTLFELVTDDNFPINTSDAKTIEIPEYQIAPDVTRLIDTPISCFQESEPLPVDKTELIDRRLFTIDNSMLPKLGEAFERLHVARRPLTLIEPELPLKFLSLRLATHGFLLRRISPD